jgi:hypothetical protein
MGYRKRTGFLAGLTVAQISEFSLILGALGVSARPHRPRDDGAHHDVGLVTIGLSTYMIIYSVRCTSGSRPGSASSSGDAPTARWPADTPRGRPRSPRRHRLRPRALRRRHRRHLLLRGRGSSASTSTRRRWRAGARQGVPVLYGDAKDPELFEHLPLDA